MSQDIKTIRLPLPFGMGTVNCYLLAAGSGYVLIDTGGSNARRLLDEELSKAGCEAGNLKLIVVTHGDFDHTGNAAHLRQKHAAKIAMHPDDAGIVEHGDMFLGRSQGNFLIRKASTILFGFNKAQRFQPDMFVEDGDDFMEFGLDARVFEIPGHSLGSIGILTAAGDLFCGDLLASTRQPELNSLMDDQVAGQASVEKLKTLPVKTIYPGHGKPFTLNQIAG
jgi:hydroxyacylglutathione hydrolase